MSYDEYARNARDDLAEATQREGDEQRAAVRAAQVWATLALAEAVREGISSLASQQDKSASRLFPDQ
ncbi:MAG: hypothetical protein ACRDRG_02835 [Pseudonocardiaceae bacterium]